MAKEVGYTDKDGNPQTVKKNMDVLSVIQLCITEKYVVYAGKISGSVVTYGSSEGKALTAHLRQKKHITKIIDGVCLK